MSIKGQGHSLTLVKVHLDFKAKCMTVGLYTQVSDSGPLGPLVFFCFFVFFFFFFLVREGGGAVVICSPYRRCENIMF